MFWVQASEGDEADTYILGVLEPREEFIDMYIGAIRKADDELV